MPTDEGTYLTEEEVQKIDKFLNGVGRSAKAKYRFFEDRMEFKVYYNTDHMVKNTVYADGLFKKELYARKKEGIPREKQGSIEIRKDKEIAKSYIRFSKTMFKRFTERIRKEDVRNHIDEFLYSLQECDDINKEMERLIGDIEYNRTRIAKILGMGAYEWVVKKSMLSEEFDAETKAEEWKTVGYGFANVLAI